MKKAQKFKPLQFIMLILLVMLMIMSIFVSFIPVGRSASPETAVLTSSGSMQNEE